MTNPYEELRESEPLPKEVGSYSKEDGRSDSLAIEKKSQRLPFIQRIDGTSYTVFPEGRFHSSIYDIQLLGSKNRSEIDDLFDKILQNKDDAPGGHSSEMAAKIALAANPEEQRLLAEETHKLVIESNRQALYDKGYHDLRQFMVELLRSNELLGSGGSPRIARILDKDTLMSEFPATFHSNKGNEIFENSPVATLSDAFLISAADGERLKKIVRDCGKADETVGDLTPDKFTGVEHDSGEKLMIKIRGVRIAFIFFDESWPGSSEGGEIKEKDDDEVEQKKSEAANKEGETQKAA